MKTRESLMKELQSRGYKLTRQRKAILEVFSDGNRTVLSAQELYERVNEKIPGTNFSTVYRNLEVLLKEKILSRIERGREASCFELCRHGQHYHHLICKSCGRIKQTEYCPVSNMPEDEEFMPVEHRFEVYGFCRECMKQDSHQEQMQDS